MNNSIPKRTGVLVAAAVAAVLTGCASTPKAPPGSEAVRSKLTDLQSQQALAGRVPIVLEQAERAVVLAETPQPDAAVAAHRVYIADHLVDTARATAETRLAEEQRAALKQQSDDARLSARTREADAAQRAAVIARNDAASSRAAAEASRIAASNAINVANNARVETDNARADANAARTDADAARIRADAARSDADAARDLAETARLSARTREAEVAQNDATAARSDAASSRAAAENSRIAANNAMNQASNARAETDSARADANTARTDADAARIRADVARSDVANSRMATEAATARSQELERQILLLQARNTERGIVLTLGDVMFASGSEQLKPGAVGNLDRLVSFLSMYPDRSAIIEGHTDSVGDEGYNQLLSQRRADSVKAYLTGKGVSGTRLTSMGKGEVYPIAGNESAGGRQQNRRVEVVIGNDMKATTQLH